MVSIERGDVSQSSFGFTVASDEWRKEEGEEVRYIKKLKRLFDVSPVTFPAYPDTDVAKRSHDEFIKLNEKPDFSGELNRCISIINLKKVRK